MTSIERHEIRYQRRKAKRLEKKESLKRYYDFNWVFSYKHLYAAYRKSRRNVGWKASTQQYRSLAPLNVYRTFKRIKAMRYKSKGFYEFTILERGKLRHIKSVTIDERVVQRCLCDYCLVPLLSRTFIYDNGASIKDKGYHFARNRVTRFLRKHYRKHGQEGYALIFDFSQFFDNISHELCKDILIKNAPDRRILKLCFHFIDMFGDVGLGLGSQISQIMALASANSLDHYIKEILQIKYYARYMDDGILIHHDKTYLKKCMLKIINYCNMLGIKINEKKTYIVKLSRGFTWLKTKFNLLESGKVLRRLTRKNIVIIRRKLKKLFVKFRANQLMIYDIWASFQSWRAYASQFNAYRTITRVYTLYDSLRRA